LITQQVIDAVVDRIESGDIGEQDMVRLRSDFPGIHFTWCMDDDIGMEEPLVERDRFNLYLVDGQGHCLKLTTDREAANGIVIAELSD